MTALEYAIQVLDAWRSTTTFSKSIVDGMRVIGCNEESKTVSLEFVVNQSHLNAMGNVHGEKPVYFIYKIINTDDDVFRQVGVGQL
jgi:hypothetical protein